MFWVPSLPVDQSLMMKQLLSGFLGFVLGCELSRNTFLIDERDEVVPGDDVPAEGVRSRLAQLGSVVADDRRN